MMKAYGQFLIHCVLAHFKVTVNKNREQILSIKAAGNEQGGLSWLQL
jgi:hypothetical protein